MVAEWSAVRNATQQQAVLPSRVKLRARRSRIKKGDCFAKAHISTAPPPSLEDARIPRTNEDEGRPQGAGGAPQEGTPSAYPRIKLGARRPKAVRVRTGRGFRVRRGCCGAESLMPCTAPESAARVRTSQYSSALMNCRTAASASASRRSWGAR